MSEYELLHPVDFAMAVAICLYIMKIIMSVLLISKEQVFREFWFNSAALRQKK